MRLFLITALSAAVLLAQASAKDAKQPSPSKSAVVVPISKAAKSEAKPATLPAFVGNKESRIYHKPDCSAAARIKAANKTTFATPAEAEKAGYKACKSCFK